MMHIVVYLDIYRAPKKSCEDERRCSQRPEGRACSCPKSIFPNGIEMIKNFLNTGWWNEGGDEAESEREREAS